MAEPNSTLREKVKESPSIKVALPQIPKSLTEGYSKKEKQKHFSLNKTLEIGALRANDLHSYISIFGEHFDLRSCIKKVDSEGNESCKEDPSPQPTNLTKSPEPGLGEYEKSFGPDTVTQTLLNSEPITYKRQAEFDKLYLSHVSDIKHRKVLRNLFMFIFGNQKLHDVTDQLDTMRIAFTKLNPYDKIPCNSGNEPLWRALKDAIEHRLDLLRKELHDLTRALPSPNLEVDVKKIQKKDLENFLSVIDAKNRHCILYSTTGSGLSVGDEKGNEWVFRLMRKQMEYLHTKELPKTPEEELASYNEILKSIAHEKADSQDPKEAYKAMLKLAKEEGESIDAIKTRLEALIQGKTLPPKVAERVNVISNRNAYQNNYGAQGGGEDVEDLDDIKEEIGRVIHTAMEHLKLVKKSKREMVLSTTVECIVGSTKETLSDAILSLCYEEPEWPSSTFTALEFKLGKIPNIEPYLQAVQRLLELKEEEQKSLSYKFKEVPSILKNIEPGKERFQAILSRYPELYKVIPHDILFQNKETLSASLQKLEASLPSIYPYSKALLADIYSSHEEPNVYSTGESLFLYLFTSLGSMRKTKLVFDTMIGDKERTLSVLLEELLKKISEETYGNLTDSDDTIDPSKVESLIHLIQKNIPPALQNKLDSLGLPAYVYVKEDKVILSATPTDMSLSMGTLFFLFLFIKYSNVLDEPTDS